MTGAAASSAPGDGIRLVRSGALAEVVLARPQRMNAMTRAMWRELRMVADTVASDPDLRVVLLRGEGQHFCAGGDIAEYPSFRFDPESLQAFHEDEVWPALRRLRDCPVPVVAQLSGHCLGAGLLLACCADMRVASESARFGAPIAHLGFPMAPREAALVAQRLGANWARPMLLAAHKVGAAELLGSGFLMACVPEPELTSTTNALVRRVATLASQAARANKRVLGRLEPSPGQTQPADDATKNVADLADDAYAYASSAEHREGIAAFLAKRRPSFADVDMTFSSEP